MKLDKQLKLDKQFGDIVGAANVLTDPNDTRAYFTDWRRQYSGIAEAVVRPASTAEVARVVALAAEHGVAIVPQGGNTGLSGGSVPTGKRREIVLALGRMNRVRELDRLNDTITVEAGCVLANVQRAADEVGRLFPLSLAAEGSCQIGGNLSTNAGGINVLRYGTAREQVLGLEVVLPDGRVWNGLRGLRKDNTGYDLKQVFIGAEGTLGIITAAVLRLHPKPSASVTAWIALERPGAAVELLALLHERLGDRLNAYELLSRSCVEAVLEFAPGTQDPLAAAHPWYVLFEAAESGEEAALRERIEKLLVDCAERGAIIDAALAQSGEQARALWRIRETVPEAQFTNVKHDIAVPVSRTADFIERAGPKLAARFPQVRVYAFGHVGDGNIHYNVGPESLVAEREAVNRIVYDTVAELGGSISAEHGLGQLKRDEIRRHKPAIEFELMRALKNALDPEGLMNPGKLL
ncbi:MAG TPA: FAD-binding oxidoreductase [Burkholderiales bacterium]